MDVLVTRNIISTPDLDLVAFPHSKEVLDGKYLEEK